MKKPRQTSVVVLITLAELAWLAAFGLLFAYHVKTKELKRTRADLIAKSKIIQEEDWLLNSTPDQVRARLRAADEMAAKLKAAEERATAAENNLKAAAVETGQLRKDKEELVALRKRLATLPPNLDELARKYSEATNRLAKLEQQSDKVQNEKEQLVEEMRRREVGEFSIRRELTGLPSGDLRRVVFVVDSSSSMHNSPSWDAARNLVRTWLEFLPVEECAFVNFSDSSGTNTYGFPRGEYLRVRQSDGSQIPENRAALLTAFDRVKPGVFSDMLRGLNVAYQYAKPDVIVVFTDGQPHVDTQTDTRLAHAILQEVEKHKNVPILTVALGSYEVEGAGGPWPKTNAPIAFLKELAKKTGGNFLGR